ncbi:hypothetical protein [Lichenicoccus roseus]|uniref:Uncharacterized protein n=1 Tax=Lichenicoccus roseus TaxID=2683649 RepID=A0A5R9JFR0_9PROT|nr:hypothetical protein [Lichenicoccus roseus]TLU74501.1 hypothetical protein FE263_04835 [Lichenicoccus roseus]
MHLGAHHEALRLLGVVFHWLLVPVEAGLVLWSSLLLLVAAGWAMWCGFWLIRRGLASLKPSAVITTSRGP